MKRRCLPVDLPLQRLLTFQRAEVEAREQYHSPLERIQVLTRETLAAKHTHALAQLATLPPGEYCH